MYTQIVIAIIMILELRETPLWWVEFDKHLTSFQSYFSLNFKFRETKHQIPLYRRNRN